VRHGTAWDSGGGDSQYGGGPSLALPRLTFVTKRLLIANAAVFLATFVLYLAGASQLVFEVFGLCTRVWIDWFPFVPLWQVGSYAFLHSVRDPGHIFWNLLLLYFFGTMLESMLGARRFLVTYAAALSCGAFLHLVMDTALGASPVPTLGASGAVLGVVVAAATLRPRTQVLVLFIPVRLWVLAAVIVGLDVFALLVGLKEGAGDGVAHWVHLGGAAWGFTAARTGWIWSDPIELLRVRRAAACRRRERSDRERMDGLLAKIHREGMSSLSRSERQFLKRVSGRG